MYLISFFVKCVRLSNARQKSQENVALEAVEIPFARRARIKWLIKVRAEYFPRARDEKKSGNEE